MIDPTIAEKAVDFLRESAQDISNLVAQAKRKEHNLSAVEGELQKEYHKQGIPATVCKSYARSDVRWIEAADEDSIAAGELRGLESRRDAAKTLIMLYMSQVKDRM